MSAERAAEASARLNVARMLEIAARDPRAQEAVREFVGEMTGDEAAETLVAFTGAYLRILLDVGGLEGVERAVARYRAIAARMMCDGHAG